MPAQVSPLTLPAATTGCGGIDATLLEASGDQKVVSSQCDVVRKGASRSPDGAEGYTNGIKGLMASHSASGLVAHIGQRDTTGRATTADLSQIRATKIEVRFRTAVSDIPNAKHAYIEITRANGTKQDLAAYPKGGGAGGDGGQLQFEAGNEKPYLNSSDKTFSLSVPPGMSRTEYANMLVDGAKHYNSHAVRYDFVGQQVDRFNSNSFVSSLIVAKGGPSGLDDVRKIAADMDSGTVNIYGQRPALDDTAMAERVRIDAHQNREIATGFANAAIEPTRFENSPVAAATPSPPVRNARDASMVAIPVLQSISDRAVDYFLRFGAAPHH